MLCVHGKIAVAGGAVPYCAAAALVSARRWQRCSFGVAQLLPWSACAATLMKYLHGCSRVSVGLLRGSGDVASVWVPVLCLWNGVLRRRS